MKQILKKISLSFFALTLLGTTAYASSCSDPSLENFCSISPIVSSSRAVQNSENIGEGDVGFCDGVTHHHRHNIQDRNKDGTFNFFVEIHQFAIELDEEILENMDTNQFTCTNKQSGTYVNCGFDPVTDLGQIIYDDSSGGSYGGITIKYMELEWAPGTPKGLVWSYGTNNNKKKPFLLDYNYYGSHQESVSMPILTTEEEFTIETRSWTKIEGWKRRGNWSSFNKNNRSGWSNSYPDYVDTDNDGSDDIGVDPDGDHKFWYGYNGIEETTFEACEAPEEEVYACEDLEVLVNGLPTLSHNGTNWLYVDDVYETVEIEVEAISDDGSSTPLSEYGDVEYRYTHRDFGQNWMFSSSDNNWRKRSFGIWRRIFQNPWQTSDDTVQFANSEPGDQIEIQTYLDGVYAGSECEYILEFPYCVDLTLNEPGALEIVTGNEHEVTIETEARASNGRDWTHDLTYDATITEGTASFDPGLDGTYEQADPFTGQGHYTSWNGETKVNYLHTGITSTSSSANVDVDAVDDVALACSTAFTYSFFNPPTEYCMFAEFIQPVSGPSPITLTNVDLEAAVVPIEWFATTNFGNPDNGPWILNSTDTDAEFYFDPSLTGSFLSDGDNTPNVVLYLDTSTFTAGNTISFTHWDSAAAAECNLLINTEILYCQDLDITIPTTDMTEAEMADPAGVEIQWTSTLTDGSPNPGPFLIEAFDASGATSGGTFFDNLSVDQGNPFNVATTSEYDPATYGGVNQVFYHGGTPGDFIVITDLYEFTTAACVDTLLSVDSAPICEDLTLSDPYIFDSSGAAQTLDLTDTADIADLYAATEVCWDYSVTYSDTETFTVFATVTGGRATITDASSGASADGAIGLNYTDTTASGTVCWTGYSEGDTISIFSDPDTAGVCSQDITLPALPAGDVCEDLTMLDSFGNTSYTMSETDADAGTIELNIDIAGSSAAWTGTLIVEHHDGSGVAGTGAGELLHSDGSPSTFGDGHLEFTGIVDGDSITVFYEGGQAGDIVYAYIDTEEDVCSDDYRILQEEGDDDDDDGGGGGVDLCRDLSFRADEDDITVGEDFEVRLKLDNNRQNQTLVVEYNCEGETIYLEGRDEVGEEFDEKSSSGRLEVEDVDGDATFDITFTNVCEGAEMIAYIEGRESACYDELNLEGYCEDVEFDIPPYEYGDDVEVCVDIESGLEDQDLKVTYYCPEGAEIIEYEGERYDGELELDGINGSEEVCFTLEDLCPGAEIEAIVNDDLACMDSVDFPAIGEFAQSIFTFNFAVEKNAYTDEGVFWSHDEDRAFYTSEYDPAGGEDAVVFWSDMWEGSVKGRVSDGDSGGSLRLAKTRTDLITGELGSDSYGYTTIEGFGFGYSPQRHLLEEDSEVIAGQVQREVINGNFRSFIPYIKFPLTQDRESELIEACDYEIDEETGERELNTRKVCFDPEVTPESDGQVRIENAGTVESQYGENAVIRVRTVAIVDSELDCGNNKDECLTEQFKNNAGVELEGNINLDDESRLVVLCPYLITRNAGDVFLQVELEGGSNIACVFDDEEDQRFSSENYANTDSLVILETPASFETDEYLEEEFIETSYTLNVDLCSGDTDGVVGSLSSYVCEIVTEVSDLWRRSLVEEETDARVSQSIRNAFTSQGSNNKFTSFEQLKSELTNVNNPNSGILYFDGDAYGQSEIVIGGSGTLTIPEGAWTLIVENADLVIAGDIAYESGASFTNLPSMAFIVNGGDVYIKNNAHQLVGVYYSDQDITGDERSPVDDPLEIDGSVYGNIQSLLEAAQYVGSPNLDEGGIVIRYDSRILLNTPPGLSEYVDVNSERAVN